MQAYEPLAANKQNMCRGDLLRTSQVFLALHSCILNCAETDALPIRLHIMYNPTILPLSLGVERLTTLVRKWMCLWRVFPENATP